jgi:TonB family protein
MKIILSLALTLTACVQAYGQPASYSQQLSVLLVKHSVILRHFYTDSELRFDSSGQLQSKSAEGFGPSDGRFIVEQVHLSPDTVVLTGRRVIEIFDSGSNNWQISDLGKPISVTIQLAQNEPQQSSVNRLLGLVFLTNAETGALQCSPEETQKFQESMATPARKRKDHPETPKLPDATSLDQLHRWCLPGGDRAYRVGRGITVPKARFTPDPDYSPDAKKLRIQGTVELVTIIAPNGQPSAISITRSIGSAEDPNRKRAGYQLDSRAVEAVSSWKFDPARFGDTPVPVCINVEVNFKLY